MRIIFSTLLWHGSANSHYIKAFTYVPTDVDLEPGGWVGVDLRPAVQQAEYARRGHQRL